MFSVVLLLILTVLKTTKKVSVHVWMWVKRTSHSCNVCRKHLMKVFRSCLKSYKCASCFKDWSRWTQMQETARSGSKKQNWWDLESRGWEPWLKHRADGWSLSGGWPEAGQTDGIIPEGDQEAGQTGRIAWEGVTRRQDRRWCCSGGWPNRLSSSRGQADKLWKMTWRPVTALEVNQMAD